MKSTNFFSDVYNLYSRVNIKKENRDFYKLDTIVYYLADINQEIVRAKNIWEIDIRSAFPTICRFLFAEESEFLQKLNELKEQKLERNIFISTTLKGTEYLKQLNLISKMIISSVLMDADPNAKILELKKDGISYIGDNVGGGKLFRKFSDLGFQIRRTKYPFYLRLQKTSHFLQEDQKLLIKGIYKDRPELLVTAAEKILSGEEPDFDFLDKVYSKKYFSIIQKNALDELFSKYYLCGENKYLDMRFQYSRIKYISDIDNLTPKNYLKLFLFPFLRGTN